MCEKIFKYYLRVLRSTWTWPMGFITMTYYFIHFKDIFLKCRIVIGRSLMYKTLRGVNFREKIYQANHQNYLYNKFYENNA